MRKNILGALLLLTQGYIYAQPNSGATSDDLQLNTITTAVPFVSITPDSRAGGMGDAGTALSANSNSIYWNTSMLSFAETSSEVSISYTPWLRQLTNDIHLSYLSGYTKFGKLHSVGGSLRYFSLGNITFTDESGNIIRDDKPNEFEITGGYAFQTSKKTSIGVNAKFIYSNLTGGLPVAGVTTKAGLAGATDISFTYHNDELKNNGTYVFAATINNIGNKMKYTDVGENAPGDFLPTNLKIGNVYKVDFDAYNSLSMSLDLQKLLVPTPAIYEQGTGNLISGKSSDVGIIAGMLQSFTDAPGTIATAANGDSLRNSDGSYQIVSGSKFKEELSEINIAFGLEYWYNNIFAIRGGVFYENKNKGGRQYANFGIGFKYNKFGLDMSYLAAFNRTNPLANTLRFSLRYLIGEKSNSSDDKPE